MEPLKWGSFVSFTYLLIKVISVKSELIIKLLDGGERRGTLNQAFAPTSGQPGFLLKLFTRIW